MDISVFVRQIKEGDEKALQYLRHMGTDAIIPLQNFFKIAPTELQLTTMEMLVMVANTSCSDFFLTTLESSSPQIRSWAANGLLKLNHHMAIPALLKTIVDYPAEAHGQFTQSAYSLIGLGFNVLPHIVPLLDNENPFVREQAWVVLSNIIVRTPAYANKWKDLWESLGRYDPHQEADARTASIKMWKRWVNENLKHTL